jgi:hypothetical protein
VPSSTFESSPGERAAGIAFFGESFSSMTRARRRYAQVQPRTNGYVEMPDGQTYPVRPLTREETLTVDQASRLVPDSVMVSQLLAIVAAATGAPRVVVSGLPLEALCMVVTIARLGARQAAKNHAALVAAHGSFEAAQRAIGQAAMMRQRP